MPRVREPSSGQLLVTAALQLSGLTPAQFAERVVWCHPSAIARWSQGAPMSHVVKRRLLWFVNLETRRRAAFLRLVGDQPSHIPNEPGS